MAHILWTTFSGPDTIEKGFCVRLYGRRNFGKTSIVKNVIAPAWEALNSTNRVSVHVDLYAVQSL